MIIETGDMESKHHEGGGEYMKPLDSESIKLHSLSPNMYSLENGEHNNYAYLDEGGYQRPLSTGSDSKLPLPSPPVSPGHADKHHTYDEIPHTKKLRELQENGGHLNGSLEINASREMENPVYDASGLKLPPKKSVGAVADYSEIKKKKGRCYRRSVCIFAMVAFAILASLVAVLLVVFYNAEILDPAGENVDKQIGDPAPSTASPAPSTASPAPPTTTEEGPTVTSSIQLLEARLVAMELEMLALQSSYDNLTLQVQMIESENQMLRSEVAAEIDLLRSELTADIDQVNTTLQEEVEEIHFLLSNSSQSPPEVAIGFENCTYNHKPAFSIPWDSTNQDQYMSPPEGFVWIGVSCSTNGINAILEVDESVVPLAYRCICSSETEANSFIQDTLVDAGYQYLSDKRYCIMHRWECPILS